MLQMAASERTDLPGQVVLVLQGGGALGAYQVGVFQALHEAGIEPDWVIGTSIGAINGAIIAGNPPPQRMARLEAFWDRVRQGAADDRARSMARAGRSDGRRDRASGAGPFPPGMNIASSLRLRENRLLSG